MKLEINKDEAFLKFSVDENNQLQVSYGFNMDAPMDMEGKVSDERFDAIMTAVTLMAGVVTCVKEYPQQTMDIGEAAIDCGDFDLDLLTNAETQEMLDNLSDEELELLFTPTEGMQ